MPFDFGWLPVGVLILLAIGFVIRARIKLGQNSISESTNPKQPMGIVHSLGWLILGFVLGSWVILLWSHLDPYLYPTVIGLVAKVKEHVMIYTTFWILGQEITRFQMMLTACTLGAIAIGVMCYALYKILSLKIAWPPRHDGEEDY